MAHLAYATSQGDGFAEITGEVGMGKTTLCRAFLEGLDKDIEAAFIFNSQLDSIQLLKAIHRELGILSIANGPEELTQDLNNFLLERKSQGKSVILLIDEAQNLGIETLEQVRLLSNLETTRNKLLQIILVGQPELREILDSHEMRPLRQRINLSYHIHPMTKKETFDYITHRVNVASQKPQTLFTRKAQKAIYRFSQGIPRLINIACDRSLLVAYSLNRKKVTPSSVKIAADELDPRTQCQPRSDFMWKKAAMIFFSSLFMLCLLYAIFMGVPSQWREKIKVDSDTVKPSNNPTTTSFPIIPVKDDAPTPVVKISPLLPEPVLATAPLIEKGEASRVLSAIKNTATREKAFLHIASLWNDESTVYLNPLAQQVKSNVHFFKTATTQNNLQMLYLEANLDLMKTFNLPAIFGIELPGDPVKGFVGVDGITSDNDYIIFPGTDKKKYKIAPKGLLPYLSGDMYVVWKDNLGPGRIISQTSPEDSIISLKLRLTEIGFPIADMSPVYDGPVKKAIKQIQRKYGLVEDGLMGPFTKIVLFNEKKENTVPYLNTSRFKPGQ
jgi:general secretion pathway protein A